MTVNFSSDNMVKIDGIHMDWQANRFITQNGYFFHGAVIEYKHPETGNLTGVAFGQEGLVVVFSNPDGSNKTGRQVMTLVKKLAEENKADVSKGQFPKTSSLIMLTHLQFMRTVTHLQCLTQKLGHKT